MLTTVVLGWILLPLAVLLFSGWRGKDAGEGYLAREDRLMSQCLAGSWERAVEGGRHQSHHLGFAKVPA